MKSFKIFFTEVKKNTHLEHIEDWILNDGAVGGRDAILILQDIVDDIASGEKSTQITVKWDGSPAIICGTDPETKNFFVGTKSVFSKKKPKLNFTSEDVRRNYSNENLQEILILSLENLKDLNIKGVLQGDLMFTKDMLRTTKVHGEELLTFKPNTITYGVATNLPLAVQMKEAQIGIIFHTAYSGSGTLCDLKANFEPKVSSLKKVPNVWFDDASITNIDKSLFSLEERKNIQSILRKAENQLASASKFANELSINGGILNHIKRFINERIRSGKLTETKDIPEIIDFIENQFRSELGKIKATTFLKNEQEGFAALIEYQTSIIQAKLEILNKLNGLANINSFNEISSGDLQVTPPEGFVSISSKLGKVVKLVNRLEFSFRNFSKAEG